MRGDGIVARKTGWLTMEVQGGKPKYLGATAEGYMGQASVDVRLPVGTIGIVARDQGRPLPTHSGIRIVPNSSVESEQSLDDLERLGRLLARETRLRSVGIQSQLRFGDHHTLLLRGGSMRLESVGGQRSVGPSAEARYIMTRPRATLTAYARTSPPSVPGAYLPGDLLNVSSRISLSPSVTFLSHAYSNLSSPVAQLPRIRSVGGSTGFQYSRKSVRLLTKANYRELHAPSMRRITQSLTTSAAIKARWLAVEGEVETTGPGPRQPDVLNTYRGRMRLFEQHAPVFGVR